MINNKRYYHLILALYSLVCFGTYFTYVYPWLIKVLLILALLALTKLKYNFNNNRILLFILLCLLFIHASISYNSVFYPTEVAILLPILAFISEEDLLSIFRIFIKLQIISIIPSLIVLFSYILGFQGFLPQYYVDWGRPFIVFPGTVVQPSEYANIGGINFYRISGIQGEAGGLGAINLLILIAERFNLKTRQNKFLLVTGLISFSFAFYLLTSIFLILSFLFDPIVKKTIIKAKWFIGIILILLFTSGFYENFIGNRVEQEEFDKNGNPRIRVPIDEYFTYYFSQDLEFITMGRGESANTSPDAYKGAGGINFMAYLYNFGLYGFFLLFSALTYLFYNGKFKSIIPVLVILSSFYQRPFMINIGYFLLFFAIAYQYNKIDNAEDTLQIKEQGIND